MYSEEKREAEFEQLYAGFEKTEQEQMSLARANAASLKGKITKIYKSEYFDIQLDGEAKPKRIRLDQPLQKEHSKYHLGDRVEIRAQYVEVMNEIMVFEIK